MLAIGRAMMAKPRLLLLDEPSLGLAPKIIEAIFQIIVQIRSEGVTVLLVEQNANQALKIADRGYVLENGTCSTRIPPVPSWVTTGFGARTWASRHPVDVARRAPSSDE